MSHHKQTYILFPATFNSHSILSQTLLFRCSRLGEGYSVTVRRLKNWLLSRSKQKRKWIIRVGTPKREHSVFLKCYLCNVANYHGTLTKRTITKLIISFLTFRKIQTDCTNNGKSKIGILETEDQYSTKFNETENSKVGGN